MRQAALAAVVARLRAHAGARLVAMQLSAAVLVVEDVDQVDVVATERFDAAGHHGHAQAHVLLAPTLDGEVEAAGARKVALVHAGDAQAEEPPEADLLADGELVAGIHRQVAGHVHLVAAPMRVVLAVGHREPGARAALGVAAALRGERRRHEHVDVDEEDDVALVGDERSELQAWWELCRGRRG